MRLLFVADKLTGGAGNVVQQLASYFSQKADNTVFLLIDASAQPKYDLSKVNIIDRRINPVKLKNPIKLITRFIKNNRKLRETINNCHVDVIVSFLNSISPEVLFSQWRTNTPIIVSERSNPYQEWEKDPLKMRIKWFVSYHRADMIVYQFHCFEPFFRFAFKRNKTRTISNMIYDSSKRSPISHVFKPDIVRFASVASLFPVKRIKLMIDMFAEAYKKHPEIQLNMYGDGPERKKLEEQVKRLNLQESIIFHGHTTDVYSVMEQNDVLLMTSEREGFPNVILEAMSRGVPTVTFSCHEGFSEIIQNGVNGFLIKQNDTNMFINQIDYIVNNPQILLEMSSNAIVMKKKYEIDVVIQQWQSCIEQALRYY